MEEQIPREERHQPSHFLPKFKILKEEINVLNVVRLKEADPCAFVQVSCEFSLMDDRYIGLGLFWTRFPLIAIQCE
jgi:hypothetical protein